LGSKAVTKKFVESVGNEDTWSKTTTKNYETNAKEQYTLTQALNDDDLSRVINCKSTLKC